MRRAKDISSDYFKADREDRFEYLYDHYGNREGVLRTQKRNFIYLVEGLMMRSSWCQTTNRERRLWQTDFGGFSALNARLNKLK